MSAPLPPVPQPPQPSKGFAAAFGPIIQSLLVSLGTPNSPFMSIVRHGLTLAAGYLASKGWSDGSQTDVLVAGGLALVGVLLSWLRNMVTTRYLTTAVSLPTTTTPAELTAAVKGETP